MKNLIGLCFFLFILLSCDNREEIIQDEKERKIKIESYYKLEGSSELQKDPNSKVFLYYKIQSIDIVGFDIDEKGKLTKGSKSILPDYSTTTGSDAICEFTSQNIEDNITIIVVSNFVKNLMSINSFLNSDSDISIKSIASSN